MTKTLHTEVKSGQRLVATDITDLTFFPKGSILMMDGDWQDGRGGWYICDGRATPYGNTPDLRDKFIKGNGSETESGSNWQILSVDNLPIHHHSITDKAHRHGIEITESNVNAYVGQILADPVLHVMVTPGGAGFPGGNNGTGRAIVGKFQAANTGITGTDDIGSGLRFNNMPSYYSMIYIKKMN